MPIASWIADLRKYEGNFKAVVEIIGGGVILGRMYASLDVIIAFLRLRRVNMCPFLLDNSNQIGDGLTVEVERIPNRPMALVQPHLIRGYVNHPITAQVLCVDIISYSMNKYEHTYA